MTLAAERDPDAWEALYRRAYPRLFAYARRRLSSSDAADDAVSEAMARSIDRIAHFEWRGAGFDAWLYGILRNVVHETWRRTPPLSRTDPVERPSLELGPLERLMDDEQRSQVRRAFGTLSSEDQEVLELRVVGGLDAEQVASVVGKRPGAVRMAQSRALARLRTAMEAAGG